VRVRDPEQSNGGDGTGSAKAAPLPIAPLDDAQRLACLRLIRSENVGPVTFRELINHFGGAQAALGALPELSRRSGRGRPVRICPEHVAAEELEAARRIGARPLFTIEPGFPAPLAHLAVPPPMLYVKGRVELLQRPAVAIVGARNGSAAGIKLTRMFARGLGDAGHVVVSGLARGIDGAAHGAALETGTVAVLAGGVDFQYPPEHIELQERIAAEGCLVSEQAPGFQPRAQDFPRRNRIISGMSLAVLIVEAAKRSGSLITARMANEQGRLVLAVPGHPLDPRAEGTLGLIKQGATMVTTPADVLEALEPLTRTGRTAVGEPEPHEPVWLGAGAAPQTTGSAIPQVAPPDASERVLSVLGPAPVDIDEIARATGLAMSTVRAALLEHALGGLIEQHGAGLVSLRVAREA
jgi:DNA processing protein